MTAVSKFSLLILATALLAIAAIIGFSSRRPAPAAVAPPANSSPSMSALAPPPDWQMLDASQETITRTEFENLLTTVFTTGDAWRNWIHLDDTEARIVTGDSPPRDEFHLRFAPPGIAESPPPRHWRPAAELPPTLASQPLAGLRIAIDPGHIGGAWAKMEERWFHIGDAAPIQEGDMTLQVANLLEPRLEALGAKVSLVRNSLEPVTTVSPSDLESIASSSAVAGASAIQIQKDAERLFYRTAEIRARADLVNRDLRPDLVLCLHFNAEAWGNPDAPTLIDRTHLHLLVNGAYTNDEVGLADQRFAMLLKLLQRTHREEIRVGSAVAATFAKVSGLPAYSYPEGSSTVRAIPGEPYLWARNLLANRLYDCPVIFLEPYVMNSTGDYARMQAGDFEGQREISGKLQASIFREYADSVAEGLAEYYGAQRPATGP